MDGGAAAMAWWCRVADEAVADARVDLRAAAEADWAGPAARLFDATVAGLLAGLTRVAAQLDHAHDAARRGAATGAPWTC